MPILAVGEDVFKRTSPGISKIYQDILTSQQSFESQVCGPSGFQPNPGKAAWNEHRLKLIFPPYMT
jgi:hypothetical protein